MGYISSQGYVGLALQAEKGAEEAPTSFVRFLTADDTPISDNKTFREGGHYRDGAGITRVGMQFPFSFDCYARPGIAGLLFTMMLGADAKTGSAAPYLHTITPGALGWWTVEMRKLAQADTDDLVNRLIDSKLSTLTFTGSAGEPLKIAVSGQALDLDSSNAAAEESYDAEDFLKFLHGTLTVFGAATTEITDFTLTIENNNENIQTSALTYAQIVEKDLDVTLDFTLKCTADDEFRKVYLGGASGTVALEALEASAVTMEFNNGLLTTAERSINFTIPSFVYSAAPLTNLNAESEVMYYACTGIAQKVVDTDLITVTVENADADEYDA